MVAACCQELGVEAVRCTRFMKGGEGAPTLAAVGKLQGEALLAGMKARSIGPAAMSGRIAAIESSHAVAGALDLARERPGSTILVNLSGRGDKDMGTAIEWFGLGQASRDGTPEPATEEQIAEGAK